MLENLDLKKSLNKADYQAQIKNLMLELRSLQKACWQQKLPVIVAIEGWAAAGKGKLVKTIIDYMDPRGFTVHPILSQSQEAENYPFLWRFWQKLPPKGKIAFFYHSWYTHVLEDRLFERLHPKQVPTTMRDINAFERQLADSGVAIAKFWLHISQKELKKRLQKYAADDLDAWRVRPEDWQQAKKYKQYRSLAEEMLVYTSSGAAPWTLVEGNCSRWAKVKVLSQLVAVISAALAKQKSIQNTPIPSLPPQEKLLPTEPNFLSRVDLSLKLDRDEYKERLREAQIQLRKLQLKIYQAPIPVLALFEGWDAAGKGRAIKRLTDVLDPRSYQVHPFAKPTDEEYQHHYLWRFWRQLPPKGTIGIFDRSWYGRVLVERVEGFATEIEWQKAYQEINEFEAMLTSAGYVLVKFWLHISPDEQKERFEKRGVDPFKQYKLTEEDWRNREKWALYDVAVNQAIARTSTPAAPWTVVPGNDKYYARVNVIETVIKAIHNFLATSKD